LQEIVWQVCGITDGEPSTAITGRMHQHLQNLGMAAAEEAPYLLHLLGVLDATARLARASPQAIRIRTFAALHQLLLRQSQRQPLLVVVENLHWIDPTSQEFLVGLVEQLAGVPLLLLVTCRPGYRPPWMDKSYATQLTLPRLAPADSQRVVQAVLAARPLADRLLEDILAKAAGNPLFLEELGWAVREHDGLRLLPEIPITLQAVLAARIDGLAPGAKQLLQTAAVIGPEVPRPLLQAVAGMAEDELRHELRQLQAAEFLYETRFVPEGAYTFKHALTHEVAYGSLLQERRRALHARSWRLSRVSILSVWTIRSNGWRTTPSGVKSGIRPRHISVRRAPRHWRARHTTRRRCASSRRWKRWSICLKAATRLSRALTSGLTCARRSFPPENSSGSWPI
jgi:predicted ATPase